MLITKSLYMHKSASKAQGSRLWQKQAYTVKVHAKRSTGLETSNSITYFGGLGGLPLYIPLKKLLNLIIMYSV